MILFLVWFAFGVKSLGWRDMIWMVVIVAALIGLIWLGAYLLHTPC